MNNKNIGAGNQVRTQLARWQSYLVPESENHGESAMTGENKSAIMIPANPIQTVAQKKNKKYRQSLTNILITGYRISSFAGVILQRKEYTDCTEKFTIYTNSLWDRTAYRNKLEDQIIFYNAHPAVVKTDVFDKAQAFTA